MGSCVDLLKGSFFSIALRIPTAHNFMRDQRARFKVAPYSVNSFYS